MSMHPIFGNLLIGAMIALPMAAAGQSASPVVALPVFSGTTDSFLLFDLGNGTGYLSDRLRDPLQIRVRVIAQNLFSTIGRPTDQPAVAGEILLGPIFTNSTRVGAALFVEASTGYVAFFDAVGRDNRLGKVLVAIGRPFAPIKSTDGNYALLMRRDGSGRSAGAFLYHATSGRGMYMAEVRQLETDVAVTAVQDLPQLTGRVTAAAIQSGREETWAYLIVDGGNGEIYYFDVDRQRPGRIVARKSSRALGEVFREPGPQAAPQRFVAVPLLAVDDRTQDVFVLDASSGEMALVEDVDGSQPALRKAVLNLYTAAGLTTGAEARQWEAIPNLAASGQTVGIWLRDSLTSRLFYVERPAAPAEMTVRSVTTGG